MCTPWRAEEGARFSGTGVLADAGLGTKHRPLRKQRTLITAEPCLQPTNFPDDCTLLAPWRTGSQQLDSPSTVAPSFGLE